MSGRNGNSIGETIRWALESALDPSMAAADWLARDIDPGIGSAVELLTTPCTIDKLTLAKDAFKTMRIVGESSADRRLGARLYAAAIAAALVQHGRRISRQSPSATARALRGLLDDRGVPEKLRALAGSALGMVDELDALPAPDGGADATTMPMDEIAVPPPVAAPVAPLEIERKYLLSGLPELPAGAQRLEIDQGYLAPGTPAHGTLVEGRLRRTAYPDGAVTYVHTIKKGLGLVREETEQRLDRETFERHWPRTEAARISKVRHRVRDGRLVWEIDEFPALDLVIAEVELRSARSTAPIPDWLGPRLVREVTEDPAYGNYELARKGGVRDQDSGVSGTDG